MEKLIGLLLLFLALFCSPLASSVSAATIIELKPDDPNVFVGNSLLMNCSVNSSDGFTSRDLRFAFRKYNVTAAEWEKTSTRIPPEYVSPLTEQVAQLNWTNVTVDMNWTYIQCRIRSTDVTDHQLINVGYPISKPIIVYHRVLNWESLIFKWKVEHLDNAFEATFTAWYKLPGREFASCRLCHGEDTNSCPKQSEEANVSSCRVKLSTEGMHPNGLISIKVNGTSELNEETESDVKQIDAYDIVEPAQVKNLAVTRVGADAPIVKFDAPKQSTWLWYTIEVYCSSHLCTYLAPCINRTFSSYDTMFSYKLSGLPSYTSCRVLVRCKPDYHEKRRDRGFWSEWDSVDFMSQEGVPVAAPITCQSCFESKEVNRTMRQVVIYYKQLGATEARGTVTEYRSVKLSTRRQCRLNLTSDCLDEMLTAAANVSHFRWLLSVDQDYKLGVEAATVAGYNDSRLFKNACVHIPAQAKTPLRPSNFTTIVVDDKIVNMSWQQHPDAGRYLVLWCIGSRNDMKCMGELQWVEISANRSVCQVNVSDDPTDYLFGMAIETDTQSSGIHWSACIYNRRYTAVTPLAVVDSVMQTSVTLKIERPFCEHKAGYVYGYIICWTDDVKSQDCNNNSISVDRSSLEHDYYTIDNLWPETNYFISVQSLTLAGPSPAQKGLKARTAGLSAGIIVGIVIAGIFLLAVIFIGFLSCFRKCRSLFNKCHKYWFRLDVKLPVSAFDAAYYDQDRTLDPDYGISSNHSTLNHNLWHNNNNTVSSGESNPVHRGTVTAPIQHLVEEDSVRPTTSTTCPLLRETEVVTVCSDLQPPLADVAPRSQLIDGYSVCLRHEKQIFKQIPTSEPNEMEFDEVLDCETPSCTAPDTPDADVTPPCSDRTSTDSGTSSSDAHASGCLYSRVARPRETLDSLGDANSGCSGGDDDNDPTDNSVGISSYLQFSKFSSETTSCDEAMEDSHSASSSSEAALDDDYNSCGRGCYSAVYDKMMTNFEDLATSLQDDDADDDPCAPMLLPNDPAAALTVICDVGDFKSEDSSLDLELFQKCFGPKKNRKTCPTTSVCVPVRGLPVTTPSLEIMLEPVHPTCLSASQPINNFSVTSPPDSKLEAVPLTPPVCHLADVASVRTDSGPVRVLPSIDSESSSSGSRWLSLLNNEQRATVV